MAWDFAKFFKGPSREERLTKMGVRGDVVAAAMRMATDARSDPTLVELTALLPDDETVLVAMEGRWEKYLGLAVLTTHRIAFAGHGYENGFLATLGLDDVLAIELPKSGRVRFIGRTTTPDGTADAMFVDRTLGTSAEQFAEAAEKQRKIGEGPAPVVEKRDPLELLAELRLLRDAGAMTPEQFEAEKAKLVADL
ncbi:hypothetical protein GIS00_16095 [Nakamurella sp. YIM 132087]|uniref:SHOCT domain-containing protein n=1 Tax=Nakamurella alba TaxID=2665158 RepID=A0A7K1FMR3_9ACTN|nr:hypothetical protein [Nakamurella alba]MTD15457.1 hypothetical protein [Nakamurella alba]